jgi:guanyl-specific ribonuclease Sa
VESSSEDTAQVRGLGGNNIDQEVVMKSGRSLIALCLVLALMLLATGVTLASSSSVPSSRATASAASAKRASVIMWNQAKRYAGSTKTVKGPVKGIKYASSSTGRPTFISIGRNYPNRSRFTVVIWGKYRSAFPSNIATYYRGKTVLVTGRIKMYQGSAQMFVRIPSKLRVAN